VLKSGEAGDGSRQQAAGSRPACHRMHATVVAVTVDECSF
jgi:hypothetical protein